MKYLLIFSLVSCMAIGPNLMAHEAIHETSSGFLGGFFGAGAKIDLLQQRFDEALSFYSEISPEHREMLTRPENQGLLGRTARKLQFLQFRGLDNVARDLHASETGGRSTRDFTAILDALMKVLTQVAPILIGIDPAIGGIIQMILTFLPIILEFIKMITGGGTAGVNSNHVPAKS